QLRDDVDDRRVQARYRPRGECLGHQSAQTSVVLTVDAEKSRGDPIPQGAGRDALRLESQPGRRGQPMVAQRGVRKLVAQNLRPVRAHGDWELLTRLLERLV